MSFSKRNFTTGTIGAANANVQLDYSYHAATRLLFSLVGTFVGTCKLQIEINAVWFDMEFYTSLATATKVTSVAVTNPNAAYIADLPPCSAVRVICSAYTSGSVVASLQNAPT